MSELSYTINDLRKALDEDKIQWSMHVLKRFRERNIRAIDFKNCIYTGEIIEYYPESYKSPSCLVSGMSIKSRPLHTVSGYDGDYMYAITAYYPDITEWENDYKTRKR